MKASRLLLTLAGTTVGLALAAAGGVYVMSEWRLRAFATPAPAAFAVPDDAATVARGAHLARTRGCAGCHGESFEGEPFGDFAVSVNLPAYVREHGLAPFEAALRHGIAHDGRAMYSMPSYGFRHLSDPDVAAIFAYLRAQPVVLAELPAARLPWRIRWDIARGTDGPIAAYLDLVPPLRRGADPDPRIARGEYFAMTTCNECHGFGLRADSPFGTDAPDLLVVTGYDEAAFTRLLHTGKALGDRELRMMSGVARGRFASMTEDEIADLYAFLKDFGARAAAPP
jgi:mono/diheme cytochrome c family protein